MNRAQYDRRIKKARASRDAFGVAFLPESFYQDRIQGLYALMRKLAAERDAAVEERDRALVALGRIKLKEVK